MRPGYLADKQRLLLLRVILLGLSLVAVPFSASSQDLRLFSVASPASGCTLSNQESVSIVIINVGPQLLNANFNAVFILNNGSPVVENITLPPTFNNGSLISYTFSATADLSAPGTYSFDAYIDLASDVNRSNDTISNYLVTSDPLSVGGELSGAATVCSSSNSGQLSLTGYTGTILNWESSTDGINWNTITNTSGLNSYSNLTTTTYYRVQVKSGACPQAVSDIDTIAVDPATIGGSVNGSTTVCAGSSGSLTLSGHTGSVVRWESSTDNGANWIAISNTSITQPYSSITIPTLFRAVLKSGVCTQQFSSNGSIGILPASVGGTTGGSDTVCSGNNSGNITLSGQTGSILRWEQSINGGSTWTNIANTTGTLNYSNLTTSTLYRAVVESCAPSDVSSVSIITVNPAPVAGSLSGAATVCATSNAGTITLSGSSGTISWENSADGVSWYPSPGNATSLSYTNLNSSTYYRAKVSNPPCADAFSNTVLITVDPQTEGGTISGTTTECVTGNAGTLVLSQHTGNVLNWETSTDNGSTWTTIANVTDSQTYINLTATTYYRAKIKSGVCSVTYSDTAIVTVVSATNAGSINGPDSVCSGSSAQLSLTNYAGNILEWQYSLIDSLSWTTVSDTSYTFTTLQLTGTTFFRTIVGTGSCPSDTSNAFKVQAIELSTSVTSDTTINLGDELVLAATGGIQYSWLPASLVSDPVSPSPTATLDVTTTFTVYITGLLGCTDTSYVTVAVTDNREMMIPNFISPNSDGINDKWEIIYPMNITLSVMIFNSNGQVVFQSEPYVNFWDGTVNGAIAPDGVYYYKVISEDSKGGSQIFKGNINLKSR